MPLISCFGRKQSFLLHVIEAKQLSPGGIVCKVADCDVLFCLSLIRIKFPFCFELPAELVGGETVCDSGCDVAPSCPPDLRESRSGGYPSN